MWLICFIISLALFLTPLLLAIFKKKNREKLPAIKPLTLTMIFVALAGFTMFLPIYTDFFEGTEVGILKVFKVIVLSLHNTIRLFVVDSDFEGIREVASTLDPFLKEAYPILSATLFISSPVLTFSFALSFFKNAMSYIKYFFAKNKDAYVFSELNDYSVTLATDIAKNHKKAVIIFTDVYSKEDEVDYELLERAELINAICFKKDITLVNFTKHNKKNKLMFFILNRTEEENSKTLIELAKTYGERENSELFIFSKNTISDLLISSLPHTNMKIRKINYAQSLIFRTLYDNGYEMIFDYANKHGKIEDGKKVISAVVVGLGKYGSYMAKTLAWYGQMDGYKIKINAFDSDKNAESIFKSECPELMGDEYNGVHVDGEAEYSIQIHSDMNYKSYKFDEKIQEIKDATFVLVSLGTDVANIECATKLRTLFERCGANPLISTIVYDSKQREALLNAMNFKHQEYNLTFIGGTETTYSEAVIIDSELEEEALERHLKYGNEEDFWKFEYNYCSSMASALHMQARIKCGIKGADKKEEDLTTEERDIIEVLEHKRWNAYMRSIGYVSADSRNDLGKQHHNLVRFAKLSEEDKRKDSKVGSK